MQAGMVGVSTLDDFSGTFKKMPQSNSGTAVGSTVVVIVCPAVFHLDPIECLRCSIWIQWNVMPSSQPSCVCSCHAVDQATNPSLPQPSQPSLSQAKSNSV